MKVHKVACFRCECVTDYVWRHSDEYDFEVYLGETCTITRVNRAGSDNDVKSTSFFLLHIML